MIRNRYTHFLHLKNRHQGTSTTKQKNIPVYPELTSQPYWYEQFYNLKENLKEIQQNSISITKLTDSYQQNPTVYSLKQRQRLIDNNSVMINKIDQWSTHKMQSSQSSTGWENIHENIKKHFALQLGKHIMIIVQSRQRIDSMNNILNQSFNSNANSITSPNFHNSFSSNQNNQNISRNPNYSFNNMSFGDSMPLNNSYRQEQFNHVTRQIQNLNGLMRRMNAVVIGQGELINRIDENIGTTQQNMKKGRDQLQRRLERQKGEGEFSIYGKINKAIMTLYIINIILIIIFLLKNLLF